MSRRIAWERHANSDPEELVTMEWLVTNGLGGYASGTVGGVITRAFHGYLVAALPSPLGRMMMLNDLVERAYLPDGSTIRLGGEEREKVPLRVHGSEYLTEFRLESGLPVWTFRIGDVQLEKRVMMVYGQNTSHISYRVFGKDKLRLALRPSVNFRPHENAVSSPLSNNYSFTVAGETFEISAQPDIPPLRLLLEGGENVTLTMDRETIHEVIYRIEESRGYAARGDLWSPGYFSVELSPDTPMTLIASVEPWNTIHALTPEYAERAEAGRRKRLLSRSEPSARTGWVSELVYAADQFVVTPAGRFEDRVKARAAGDDVKTVIAGYPWFTDWGRDTMISLEGLTLITGRHQEAGFILRTFAQYVRHGLIPNMFPEGQNTGLYHTADATLWFFHAIHRYLKASNDETLISQILPKLTEIINCHLRGTDFGIRVDPSDGLLTQGEEGYQLTWMDAKVGDWVVTPRRGKAVEINALWYNALCLMESWLRESGADPFASQIGEHARRAKESFQNRFWREEEGCLYDVVDGEGGDDESFRPNQILSFSLDYPILEEDKWEPVLTAVKEKLLTPVGLRSLAPGELEYKARYDGELRSRDAAYHQGTVWAWLIGPFVDAWLRVYPTDSEGAQKLLKGFDEHLGESAIGSISEIFDAEKPYTPRGCVAQAWSVAEVLRSYVKAHDAGKS